MKPAPLQSLVSLLQALAREAVCTQQRLDDFWETSAAAHLAHEASLGLPARSELAALHRALTPARLVARRMEFSLAVNIEQGRSTGFELKAVPLNLSFAITHRTSATTSAHVRIEVEAVTLPVNADAAGRDFETVNHTNRKDKP